MDHNLATIYPQSDGDGKLENKEVVAEKVEAPTPQPVMPMMANEILKSALVADDDNIKELANAQPIAVVKTLSTRGLEYVFMSIALWFAAAGLIWTLLLLVNGQNSAILLTFPATALIVCAPVFAFFFLRLKKAELNDSALRFDPSKRRLSQITQTVAFIVMLANTVTFVYLVIASATGVTKVSVLKAFLNLLVITTVAGGILAYYWMDEHRPLDR